ncbi:hypothetical protein HHL11_12075 [Ramlibacter sp. G-1-2-2]|uniref:Uncharacterized protein n=1 Tax=Ramlibacter agri TaxID=2728837 RepID=A0A848H7I2_9BURK|nr:hypothetical protein [Ramlibacter agri]NML44493.1 hypothetical protein [Ramlibacter agri]
MMTSIRRGITRRRLAWILWIAVTVVGLCGSSSASDGLQDICTARGGVS